MKQPLLTLLLSAIVLTGSLSIAEAGRKRCESTGTYEPPRGVYRVWSRKLNKRWETYHHCLPCGRKIPYRVRVVTYRDRYSNGVIHEWDCILRETEVTLGK